MSDDQRGMNDYDASTYGERIAGAYDTMYPATESAAIAVATLADLAGEGTIVELGIGTGRLALPLVARGRRVSGVDASPAMVEQLRSKPGGSDVDVRIGDFASTDLGADHALVFVAFNTFFALTDQEAQIACFANVARSLTTGGRFALEAFVPDLGRFSRGQNTSTTSIALDRVGLESSVHDPVHQRVESMHVVVTPSGIEMYPVVIRYAWPAELDLMARLAGLRLEHRWGGWDRRPFTRDSGGHVSVWRR